MAPSTLSRADVDGYQFDSKVGPVEPPWRAWNESARVRLEDVTLSLQEYQAPLAFTSGLEAVRSWIGQVPSGILWVEGPPGVGKSCFGACLESAAGQLHTTGIRVAFIKVARRPYGDYEMFIENVNEQLAASQAPRRNRIVPLDRLVVHDLAVQFPSPNRRERWNAFLASLSQLNRGPILLYLDEIDRRHQEGPNLVSPLDYLRAQMPEQVYLAVSYSPEANPAFLKQLQVVAGSQLSRLELAALSDYRSQVTANTARIGAPGQPAIRQVLAHSSEFAWHWQRLASQAWTGGLIDPGALTDQASLYSAIARGLGQQRPEECANFMHFLLTLCAAFEPIRWEEVGEWGTSVDTIQGLVDLLPATLLQQKPGVSFTVDIGHESLRDFLVNQNQSAFARVCRGLVGWVVHKIRTAEDLKLSSEQGREWARLAFYRLYRWCLLCQDVTVLEWVVRDKDLKRKQESLFSALDSSAGRHQKLGILDLWVEANRLLVDQHQMDDLRPDLAWALNSRGLTYLSLHRRQRALVDLEESLQGFDRLVHQERKTQHREGLAAAFDRRGEIHLALNRPDRALSDGQEAVRLYTDLVEDMGREDLLSGLALAQRNLAAAWAASDNGPEAIRSLLAALKILLGLKEGAESSLHTVELARCYLQLAQRRQLAGQHQESLQDSGKAVILLNQLSERDASIDLRDFLEQAHLARGNSYLAMGETDKALRDFTKSILLSTQLLEEGRLDVREELARSQSTRGKVQFQAGQFREAIRDLGSALELHQQLLAEGRSGQGLEVANDYLLRAEAYRADGQHEACRSDLAATLTLLASLSQQGSDVTSLQSRTLRQKADLGLQLGRFEEVVADTTLALPMLGGLLNREPEAELLLLRAESHRRLGDPGKARADIEACIHIYTEMIQAETSALGLVGVAEAYHSLAQVSLLSGELDRAQKEVGRAVEAFEVAALGSDRRANLARAYSTRGEVLERLGRYKAARAELDQALTLFSKLIDGEGQQCWLEEQALAYRRLGRVLLGAEEASAAGEALDQASRRYKDLWTKDHRDRWLDELWRTQVVGSAVSILLKEYGRAEEVMQRGQEHFFGLLRQGKVEYLEDVLETALRRTNNFVRVGMYPKAGEELTRLLEFLAGGTGLPGNIDSRAAIARVLQGRAGVYVGQQWFEQAYNDYEGAVQTLRTLVVDEGKTHLAGTLAEVYRNRASMLVGAGHAKSGQLDLSEAIELLKALLGQGRQELRRPLSQLVCERADAYLSNHEVKAAVEDLSLGIELLLALTPKSDDSNLFADLAQMLAKRANCLQEAHQVQLAREDYEKAVQLFTHLVETRDRTDLTVPLGECLLSHLSLAGQGVEEPQRIQALGRAVRAVTQQARGGKSVPENFVMDAVTIVRNSLTLRPQQANTDLVESVIKLCEVILLVPRLSYYWASLTELLTQCYQALDTIKGPKYVAFLCLSCASCGREVEAMGAASTSRLVYFLTLLGITLNSERPGEQLALIGNAFNKLVDQLATQQRDAQLAAGIQRLALTWQQLPAEYPAAANVSRGMLTNLSRLGG
ncbi:tetratricopeptide repeat protein [bacterium]|nr:tetratricopeptide repeat protein [bacterium]